MSIPVNQPTTAPGQMGSQSCGLPLFQDVFNDLPVKSNKAFESVIDRPSRPDVIIGSSPAPIPSATRKANSFFQDPLREAMFATPPENGLISSGSSLEELQAMNDRMAHKRRFEMVDQQIRSGNEKIPIQYASDDQEIVVTIRSGASASHPRTYSL
jgi:hypothetical protein